MQYSSRPADATSPGGIDRNDVQDPADRFALDIPPADDDLDLTAEGGRRTTKLTVVLMAAVLAGLAFVGGALVQQQFGADSAFPGQGTSARAGGMPAGGMAGGFARDGASAEGSQGQADTGSSDGTGSAAQTPVVVGTVTKISGRTITVKNFAGTSVTVKVPEGATVSDSSDSALTGLAKGSSVSVAGDEGSDGTVTAGLITVR